MNKTLLTYILIVGIAGTAGATAGIVGKRLLGQEEIDYSGFNPEDFRADGEALLAEYNSDPNKNFTAPELVAIGLQKYKNCENSYSIGIGVASTVVEQTVRNFQIKNGDQYFEESISKSSMVGVANRAIQNGKDGEISLYIGKANGSESASYPEEGTTYSKEDYKNYLGKTLDEMFVYLISNNSTLRDGTEINRTSDKIEITLNLNPDIATYYYKIQMKNISNLDKLPVFSYLKHTYTFDKNMMLKQASIDEKYSASMGITVDIRNNINYYYYANEYVKIPNYNENLTYEVKGE